MSIKNAILDFAGLRTAVQSLGAEHKRLIAEIETLKRRREDTAAQPVAKADLIGAVNKLVDDHAANYREALAERLRNIGAQTENIENGLVASPRSWQNKLLGIVPGIHRVPDTDYPQSTALMLLFGDAIKATLRREVEALDLCEGLPLAQRRVELKRLDKEISGAEEQLAKLRAEASDSGIFLDQERLP